MIKLAELQKQLGPGNKKQLAALQAEIDAANQKVAELERLQAERRAERTQAAALATATAATEPSVLAANKTAIEALDAILGAIEGDLTAARERGRMAQERLRRAMNTHAGRLKSIADFERKIEGLTAQRDAVQAELQA